MVRILSEKFIKRNKSLRLNFTTATILEVNKLLVFSSVSFVQISSVSTEKTFSKMVYLSATYISLMVTQFHSVRLKIS